MKSERTRRVEGEQVLRIGRGVWKRGKQQRSEGRKRMKERKKGTEEGRT